MNPSPFAPATCLSTHMPPHQRAMLQAMGIENWWPHTLHTPPKPDHATAAPRPAANDVALAAANHSAALPQPTPHAVALHTTNTANNWASWQTQVTHCQNCSGCNQRQQALMGRGTTPAPWLWVTDAPNREENATGQSFTGQTGQLLNAMMAALGLDAQQVHLTHAIKCHPNGGRAPSAPEIEQCRTHLHQQLQLVAPHMVLAMGRQAATAILGHEHPHLATQPIGQLRGQVHHIAHPVPTAVVVTYDPSYLLRHPADKAKAWQDLCLAMSHWHDQMQATATPH